MLNWSLGMNASEMHLKIDKGTLINSVIWKSHCQSLAEKPAWQLPSLASHRQNHGTHWAKSWEIGMLNSQSSKKWSHNIWTFSDLVTISHKVCRTEMQKPHLVLHLQELVPRQRWPPGPAPGRQRHYGGSSGGSSGHRRGWRHLIPW